MNESIKVIVHPKYEKNSTVKDRKIHKLAKRKIEFIRAKGLAYCSLNAKKLHNKYFKGVELWEFYITKKWRCFFTFDEEKKEITIIRISNHL